MKKLSVLIFSLFLVSCSSLFQNDEQEGPNSLPRDLTASEMQIVESAGSFSYELFHQTVQADSASNIFISPLSVSMALGMTLNGSSGETRQAMKETLHLQDMDMASINESYSGLIKLLTSADPKVKMKLANSVWIRQGFEVKERFKEVVKKYFKARVESLDFSDPSAVDKINEWVSNNTEELIDSIIEGEIPARTMMYLINAIYFKGDWQYQFDPSDTADKKFNLQNGRSVSVEMMSQKNELAAYVSNEVKLLDLPYGDSLFTMTLMMPANEETPINEFIQNELTASNVRHWLSEMSVAPTNIALPKFEMKYKIIMNDVLQNMGMGIAFSRNADFSNMAPGLFISVVKHKSFITVDEEGTEAAAVTSVRMTLTSAGPKIRTIRFNRPFVFLIRERTSGTILFMGKMKNPAL
ncbi:MAG TPA: serpin family protein [Balneolaceae bacterium]|nr:serpin family protein [Balneolaceae bacterium]